ncbi:hypothetical protein ILUMI_18854 [Ignelater luminosus]|uniref:Peptidase S1 domain-containing protein n=1 Tax=Ignelater luminosus TaxID=2038154 RepID=A0A8K0CH83_IGNLU|nr:hypothetical protein ILUMI_18854 [Ignelater luminosus]
MLIRMLISQMMCQCYFDRTYIVIILTLIFCLYSVSLSPKDLEVEGVGKYPYMVVVCQIRNIDIVKLCGGTLIQPQWVLTSHTCKVADNSIIETEEALDIVVASVYNLNLIMEAAIRPVKVWMKHPEYGKNDYAVTNDIALINLESAYIINQNMQPIMLSSEYALHNKELHIQSGYCNFIFWKISKAKENIHARKPWLVKESRSTILQQLTVKFVPHETCLANYVHGVIITHGQFCVQVAEEKPFPLEHSGGPLVCQDIQVGIFTWQKVVNETLVVAVFTRIDAFERYITSVVSNLVFANISSFRTISEIMMRARKYSQFKRRGSGTMYHTDNILSLTIAVLSVILSF